MEINEHDTQDTEREARKEFTGDGRTNPYASERKRLDEERKKI